MTAYIENLQNYRAEIKAARTDYYEKNAVILKKILQDFLAEYPSVTSVYFTGYVPYFNDGEACLFRLHEVCISGGSVDDTPTVDTWNRYVMENGRPKLDDAGFPLLNPDYDADADEREHWYEDDYVGKVPEDVEEGRSALSNTLHDMEDIIEHAFGEHIRVRVTREGINIEEYTDHD